MRFYSPFYLVSMLLIPLLIFYLKKTDRIRKTGLQFPSINSLKNFQYSGGVQFQYLPRYMRFVTLALIIIALARPQSIDKRINRDIEGIDIGFVLDVSESMNIEDFKPNRISVAKRVLKDFVSKRFNDRIGLVVFSGESFTQCPPTIDYRVLLNSIEEVEPGMAGQATAIGMGIANGVNRLKTSTAKSKVMILMSDGDNNAGEIDPMTAAEIAKGYGIKIHSIIIGREGIVPFPQIQTDMYGRKVKMMRQMNNTVNESLLRTVSSMTGGEFFRAEDAKALESIMKKIDIMEKTKISVQEYVKYDELFPNFVGIAFILLIVELILSTTLLRKLP